LTAENPAKTDSRSLLGLSDTTSAWHCWQLFWHTIECNLDTFAASPPQVDLAEKKDILWPWGSGLGGFGGQMCKNLRDAKRTQARKDALRRVDASTISTTGEMDKY